MKTEGAKPRKRIPGFSILDLLIIYLNFRNLPLTLIICSQIPIAILGGRIGVVVFHTAGLRLESFDEMPAVVKTEIRSNWPVFQSAPPPDDTRPSMTSWDQFKRWKGEKRD